MKIRKETDRFGTIRYYNENNQLHRDNDLPALEFPDGSLQWYQDGLLHRELDKPASIMPHCSYYYKHGILHRENGPVFEYTNGDKYWCQNNKWHREDGPAIIKINGLIEYWYDGKPIPASSDEEFLKLIKLKAFW